MNKKIDTRVSRRLVDFDYTSAALYFVTICVRHHSCIFGKVRNNQMHINDLGIIAQECWYNISNHYPKTKLHEFIVMPNHVHGIIEITKGNAKPLGSIVRGFKASVTKLVRDNNTLILNKNESLWQRNYYDHIIRNKHSYENIAQYIINNPMTWRKDRFYK